MTTTATATTPTASGSPRPEPTLDETLRTGDQIENQLSEHWQEYAAFQARLDELRSAQESLRRMASSVSAATEASRGITATLTMLITQGREPDAWGAAILALASEAVGEVLINTGMHSNATSTQAGMKRHAGWLLISLSDNGCGGATFTPDGGLAHLRDRMRSLGGMISIDSEPGTGTTVTVALPLKEPRRGEPPAPTSPRFNG